MRVDAAGATHVGHVRSTNEDSFLASPRLAVVADGMGGHACGDIASALVITTFEGLAGELREPLDVTRTVQRANDAILAEVSGHPERAGMGTTVTGVAVLDHSGVPHWLVFNVGDSRVYRIADGAAHQLTVDHSETAELVATGRITADQARTHPLRHVVTRALGAAPTATTDNWLVPMSEGDLLLVCSDGLTDELEDDQIARIVGAAADLEQAIAALIEAALGAGGHDNVTVVLLAAHQEGSEADLTAPLLTRTVPRRRVEPACP